MGGKLSSDGQQIRDNNELISVTLYPASRGPDYEGIIAAALSAAFGEGCVYTHWKFSTSSTGKVARQKI